MAARRSAAASGGEPLTPERQVALWVQGKPTCPNTHGECCPDFSCCRPKLLVPLAVRKRFAAASQKDRERMCMDFLGAVIAAMPKGKRRVHVVGGRR